MMNDKMNPQDGVSARMSMNTGTLERMLIKGVFTAICRDKDGNEKWRDTFKNTVVTVGKNLTLDTLLGGSGYSVTGPFLGLISSAGFTAISAADTMSSHTGWVEAGNANPPTYSGTRKTLTFAAASSGSKASNSTNTYTFTGSGTVKGAFVTLGTGAVNTIDNTSGTLLSAGLFTGGDRAVLSSDTLTVSYTLSM